MSKITVVGSGGWGTAIAVMTSKHGNEVTLFSVFEEEIEQIKKDRENKKLLPGVAIPENIMLTSDLSCVQSADFIVLAVPSFAVRSTCKKLAPYIDKGAIIVNIAKGLEEDSLKRLSQVIEEELPQCHIAIMSGPSHAEEVARGIPTTNVVSSKDKDIAEKVQDCFMNDTFRLYTNDDLIGAELGGSLKNVIALAAGIVDGMGFGDNTKAALMTRGITEMVRLGVAIGAKSETFAGLTGFGDLIVTCTSIHSRNRRCGILIGKGMNVADALKEIGMTVEGYRTSKAAYTLAKKANVEMPIMQKAYEVLYENKNPKIAIAELMTRTKKHETEDLWIK
jgi:glycerol-3-phosphate dehydrogenase (NAD(P)+)